MNSTQRQAEKRKADFLLSAPTYFKRSRAASREPKEDADSDGDSNFGQENLPPLVSSRRPSTRGTWRIPSDSIRSCGDTLSINALIIDTVQHLAEQGKRLLHAPKLLSDGIVFDWVLDFSVKAEENDTRLTVKGLDPSAVSAALLMTQAAAPLSSRDNDSTGFVDKTIEMVRYCDSMPQTGAGRAVGDPIVISSEEESDSGPLTPHSYRNNRTPVCRSGSSSTHSCVDPARCSSCRPSRGPVYESRRRRSYVRGSTAQSSLSDDQPNGAMIVCRKNRDRSARSVRRLSSDVGSYRGNATPCVTDIKPAPTSASSVPHSEAAPLAHKDDLYGAFGMLDSDDERTTDRASSEAPEDRPAPLVPGQLEEDDIVAQVLRGTVNESYSPEPQSKPRSRGAARRLMLSEDNSEDISAESNVESETSSSSDDKANHDTPVVRRLPRKRLSMVHQRRQPDVMLGQEATKTVVIPKTTFARGRRLLLPSPHLPGVTIAMRGDVQFIDQKDRYRVTQYSLPSSTQSRTPDWHVEDAILAGDNTVVVGYNVGAAQICLIPLLSNQAPRRHYLAHKAHSTVIENGTRPAQRNPGIRSLAPVHDRQFRFVSGGHDKKVYLWTARRTADGYTATSERLNTDHSQFVSAVAYNAHNETVLSASGWKISSVNLSQYVKPKPARTSGRILQVHVHPEKPHVAILEMEHMDRQVHIFDTRKSGFDRTPVSEFGYRSSAEQGSQYTKGSLWMNLFALGYSDGTVRVWDFRQIGSSPDPVVKFQGSRRSPVVHTVLSGSNTVLAYGKYTVDFWSMSSGES